MEIKQLEEQLDSFDRSDRDKAVKEISEKIRSGKLEVSTVTTDVNLHCHTSYSYNCYGYSPSKFAWLAKKRGLALAGIVDFDVVDGVDEFIAAARLLNLKYCCGMETRVFVPEFASRVINSPGEPGIAYHMGAGITSGKLNSSLKKFQMSLFETAQNRNKELVKRVNSYLRPVELDYEKDVLPLTPAANATERHICLAYARKAGQVFGQTAQLAKFWAEKLGTEFGNADLPESAKLLNTIRSKTMKRGGVGYVAPDGGSFVKMAEMNQFVLDAGGIPTIAWLDGTSDGEKSIDELADVAQASGAAAINIIPDRNYTPGVKDQKLANLYAVVEMAQKRNLPVIVGTEMNSPGNKFVDSFETEKLKPLVPVFLKGAHIMYAHMVLQEKAGIGYTSKWADKRFKNSAMKNDFFESVGKGLSPAIESCLDGLKSDAEPGAILNKISSK
jgi:hypothetical protein